MNMSEKLEKYGLGAGAFWILDLVVEGVDTIADLSVEYLERLHKGSGYGWSGVEILQEQYNKPWHGLSEEELIETFIYLSSNDLIFCEFHRSSPSKDPKPKPKQYKLDLEFLKLLLYPDDLGLNICYGLTAKGGALWESITSPNWDLYISGFATTLDDNSEGTWKCITEGSDRALIERCIDESGFATPVDPAAVVWTDFSPWQATYWKTLPHGYRAEYIGKNVPPEESSLREACGMLTGAPEWYTSPLKEDESPQGTCGVVENYEIGSEKVYAHLDYARLLEEQGRPDEAEKHYQLALQINPEFADAHKNYAALLDAQGRTEEANQHYHRALEIDLSA